MVQQQLNKSVKGLRVVEVQHVLWAFDVVYYSFSAVSISEELKRELCDIEQQPRAGFK